jgi:hypothetical protein
LKEKTEGLKTFGCQAKGEVAAVPQVSFAASATLFLKSDVDSSFRCGSKVDCTEAM